MSPEARPLRFLFITADPYPTYRADVAVLFGKELAAREHRIDWLMQDGQGRENRFVEQGASRWWLAGTRRDGGRLRRLHKHWLALRNDLRARALVAREDYDFVQVKDKFLGGLVGLAAARHAGRPFVYWLSWPFPEASFYMARSGLARYPILYRIRGLIQDIVLYRILLPRAAHVFVQSEQMKRDLAARGVAPEKMTPVPMGIDFDEIREVERLAPNPAQSRDIVYLGALDRGRRVDFLLRVFARVYPRLPAARLLLVGGAHDPGDIEALRRLASELGIEDRVVFTGFQPRPLALQMVRAAYACVSPFYPTPVLQSTSPTKLVEYMALGKAVVANDHPEQSRILAQSGGGLCVPYDEARFAEAIIALLRDPERVAAMGERARRYVLKHRDYRVLASSVEQRYRQIVAEAQAAQRPKREHIGAERTLPVRPAEGDTSRFED